MGEIRTLLKNALIKHGISGDIALLYSGGFESFTSLVSCLDCGFKPTLYTFFVEGTNSYDIEKSRHDSKYFGLKLVEVVIPSDINILYKDVVNVITKTKCSRKTVVQCMHPIYYTLNKIEEKNVMIGLERGQIWGLTRKGCIAGKAGIESFNEYRNRALEDDIVNSTRYICEEIKKYHNLIRLYDDDCVYDWFMRKSWEELNTPHSKQVILDEYEDIISKVGMIPKKANYQIEGGIRELHDKLLTMFPGHKKVVAIYNNILKEINDAQVQLYLEFD